MIVGLGLALIAGAFGAAALIRTRKFVVTAVAAIAITLFVSVENLRCENGASCSCTQASIAAATDRSSSHLKGDK